MHITNAYLSGEAEGDYHGGAALCYGGRGACQRGSLSRKPRGLIKEASCRGGRGGLSRRPLVAESERAYQRGSFSRRPRGLSGRLLFTEAAGAYQGGPCRGSRGACQGGSSSQKPRVFLREAPCRGRRGGLSRRPLVTEAEAPLSLLPQPAQGPVVREKEASSIVRCAA